MEAECKAVGEQRSQHPLHSDFICRAIGLCRYVEVLCLEPVWAGDLAVLEVVGELNARVDGYVLHAKGIARKVCLSVVFEFHGFSAGPYGCNFEAGFLRSSAGKERLD